MTAPRDGNRPPPVSLLDRIAWWGAFGALLTSIGTACRAPTPEPFEGEVTYRMVAPDGRISRFAYYQKGPRTREEIGDGETATVTILDGETGEATILIPSARQYMTLDFAQIGARFGAMAKSLGGPPTGPMDLAAMEVTATGERETVAGVPCAHYRFQPADGSVVFDVCGAAGMGFLGTSAGAISPMPRTFALAASKRPELAAVARNGFFPLKIAMTGRGQTMTMEATELGRRSLDGSLFAAPDGYTRLPMPGSP